MKRATLTAVAVLIASPALATTWYVRTDGGSYGTTASTCNGQTDAAFTGSNGPGCAVNHPFEILGTYGESPRVQRIAASDTVIIKNGSYRMGYTAGTYDSGSCFSAWTYDCVTGTIPSGTDASNKTKIYGEGYASCTTKPELWGTHGARLIFDLEGSSNVDIQCLDLTDHDDCGGQSGNLCTGTTTWGRRGIVGWNGTANSMTNVLVHGFAYTGVMLGKQTTFTASGLSVYGNGLSGFDQDNSAHSGNNSWSGTNSFTNLVINWNGCAENYPVDGNYNNCTDQNDTGYGDGWGSPNGGTAGSFSFVGGEFRFNTSDALDLLYNTDVAATITVDRVLFEGNVGNLVKVGGANAIIRNSAIIANCGFWDGFSSKGENFAPCRAGGNAVVLDLSGGGLADLVNNTIVGEPDILVEVFGCNGGEALNIQNNVMLGTTQYGGGDTTSWFYAYSGCVQGTLVTTSTAKNNIIYGAKEGASACTGQTSCSTANPTLTSTNFTTEAFNLRPQTGSPAIDYGLDSGTTVGQTTVPTVDILGAARVSNEVDAGAYEFSTSTPVMATCSLPAGTVGVAYSQQIVVTGGTLPYTACDETAGALPSGSPAFASTPNGSGCLITGTPTGAETANFTERVTDDAAQTDSEACTLVINASAPTITTTTLPDGIVGFAYSAQVDVTGGTLPYTLCDESVGSLPAGSPAFTSTANAGGCLIEGTPTEAGTTNFTERVTDSDAQTDTQALSIDVAASAGTILYGVNQGSAAVVVRYGFAGLPFDADCNFQVVNATTQQVAGSALSTSGPSTRTGIVTGLTPSTAYTATLSCDVPSGEQYPTFTTFPASSGSQTVPITLGAPSPVLSSVARLTVEYDDNPELSSPASSQNTSCASGCTVNLSLTAGLYWYRYIWQTAADAVLATSPIQPLPVP